jgi:1-acyl-sn-glycerol-3-phosphate acyltransferase
MFIKLAKFSYRALGWKAIGLIPAEKKYVVVMAPHTSNWDFFYGRLFSIVQGYKPKVLIKRELFFFPLGSLLKKLGGIPVYRNTKNNLVEQIVDQFARSEALILGIAPEGTRKRVTEWKKGFYFIALSANVPIYLSIIDYKLKSIGIMQKFEPTGIFDDDIKKIKAFYANVTPKYPDKFCGSDS